jgi:hypothetical protein
LLLTRTTGSFRFFFFVAPSATAVLQISFFHSTGNFLAASPLFLIDSSLQPGHNFAQVLFSPELKLGSQGKLTAQG